jgi:predicted nucleotidyltransferase
MDNSIKADLDTIVGEINSLIPDSQIFLFGSYATGRQRLDSDLDLCVIAKDYTQRPIEMMHIIRDAIADKTKLPIDLLVFKTDEFEKNALLRPTIEYAIANEGVLLNA